MCLFTREPNETDAINSGTQRDKYVIACQTPYATSQHDDSASRNAGSLLDDANAEIVER